MESANARANASAGGGGSGVGQKRSRDDARTWLRVHAPTSAAAVAASVPAGKWLLYPSQAEMDAAWRAVQGIVAGGGAPAAKTRTIGGSSVICVYSGAAVDAVFDVLCRLRAVEQDVFRLPLTWKTEDDTRAVRYGDDVAAWRDAMEASARFAAPYHHTGTHVRMHRRGAPNGGRGDARDAFLVARTPDGVLPAEIRVAPVARAALTSEARAHVRGLLDALVPQAPPQPRQHVVQPRRPYDAIAPLPFQVPHIDALRRIFASSRFAWDLSDMGAGA